VPLWLLAGEVDDANSHDDNAYNEALADAGYTMDIIASDGYTVSLDSKLLKRNDSIILAFMVNEAELPEQYYPLRLVGAGLDKKQMAGKVTTIQLNLAPVPTPTTAAISAPVEGAGITITGLVNQELTLTDADLKAMQITTVNATGKNGPQDFQGILLNAILDRAGIKDGATKLVFTASDNYTAEVNLSDVRDCPNTLLAFMDTPGAYLVVLPDQPTSTWVKNVIKIEIK
jgi:DMSO/TMAO reductase YedYZ molybdopterin-dependent catalytic subunit